MKLIINQFLILSGNKFKKQIERIYSGEKNGKNLNENQNQFKIQVLMVRIN